MARLLKCYGNCGQKYPKEQLIQYKSKNYCNDCYKKKKIDDEGRHTLHEVISKVYEIPYPTGQMLRQMKTFREERNYSYENQAKALLYGKFILKKVMKSSYGLGLIPYIIDDAVRYYDEQVAKAKSMEGKKVQHESKIVKKKTVVFEKDEKLKQKLIPMEDLLK